jgi:hypothetical protein
MEKEIDLKKQKRLLKNRESANASRERKKQYTLKLEKELHMLGIEYNRLYQYVLQLQQENINLKSKENNSKNLIIPKPKNETKDLIQKLDEFFK